jgi:pentatricopeptide repeat protein
MTTSPHRCCYCKTSSSGAVRFATNKKRKRASLSTMALCLRRRSVAFKRQFTLLLFSLLCAASTTLLGPNIILRATSFFIPTPHPTARTNGWRRESNNRASLFSTLQHQSVMGSGEGTNHNTANDDDDGKHIHRSHHTAHPLTLQPDTLISKLESFIPNISRYRMAKKKRSIYPTKTTKYDADDDTNINNVNDALINACTSLVYFLNNEAASFSSSSSKMKNLRLTRKTVDSIREVLELVLIQAVRAASEVGDFVLINKLILAAVGYATAVAKNQISNDDDDKFDDAPLLTPRIFGEVITSLSKTKASNSKIKSIWNFFIRDVANSNKKNESAATPTILSSGPSSYELNAMLRSLGERNKVSTALSLYRQMIGDDDVKLEGDAYTASILFAMLADSIANGSVRNMVGGDRRTDNFSSKNNILDGDCVSPCWQWNEAMSILDTFSSSQLNNFAYAALLKVNEQATDVFCDIGARHNGVKFAMLVLERMKVSFQILHIRSFDLSYRMCS